MKLKHMLIIALVSAIPAGASAQQVAARFNMSLTSGDRIEESVTHNQYVVTSHLPACTVKGLNGDALRFDGYSNYVKAGVPVSTFNTDALTISAVLTAEAYPMMQVDVAESTPTFATVFGNLDDKKGFALELSSQGDLRFRFGSAYANGYLFTVNGEQKLPRGKWNVVTIVLDKAANAATIYLNGNPAGSGRMSRADIVHSTTDFYIGKDATNVMSGPFLINTFVGLIDDITVYNGAMTAQQVADLVPDNPELPDFNYPAERYASSLWRPQFHGMPSGGWTNESHGMTYIDGKFHVFFQKNANGPYMSRLHWGHITSENLYLWREEPIAIAPGESYDIKGCWSGCVYDNNGTPSILYTAVDNARAVIAQASPVNETLIDWNKQGIIINGRPSGLSDDFRDPYHFTANGQQYIIVGTSKNGVGACTLHKLEGGTWTNDGSIFFQGGNANQHGTFWEMPNVTDMGGGKWLFTCTPLGMGSGVRTLCWTGSIGADGKFVPDGNGVQYLEMGGISRDGYGLLSPTIYKKDGKILMLGIVPDKLPTNTNYNMGWAHNYSLPREISLAADGSLVQKPYSGLTGMRTTTAVSRDLTLNGTESLAPVSGRQIELMGEFTVSSGTMGFNFLKSGDNKVSLTYDAASGNITLNMTSLNRTSNDGGVYNGVYTAALPKRVAVGETLKLHVYLDGSIADIFVNDTWAFSVRIFPNDATQIEAEAFATVATSAHIKAWTLDPTLSASDDGIKGDVNGDGEVNIADINAIIDIILSGNQNNPKADVNGDGEVNIADVNAIIDIILS
ncbi:MAG: GH32 C-terminal domain-containing protein [Muribaculaceae bacterium]|nr:GH32 C-terminal domain-containing protein [Muribaculaceae bacterium]